MPFRPRQQVRLPYWAIERTQGNHPRWSPRLIRLQPHSHPVPSIHKALIHILLYLRCGLRDSTRPSAARTISRGSPVRHTLRQGGALGQTPPVRGAARLGRPLVIPGCAIQQVGTGAIPGARNNRGSRKGNQWKHPAPNSEYRNITGTAPRSSGNGWLGGYAGWGAGTAGEEVRRLIKAICSARLAGDGEYGRGGRGVGVGVGRMGSTCDRERNKAGWRRWEWGVVFWWVRSDDTSRRRTGLLVGFGNPTVDRIFWPFKNDSVSDVGVERLSRFFPDFLWVNVILTLTRTSTQEYGGGWNI
ncbi:hypothetical protein JB92DRAFT_3100905 [Gautieria morchelliformis]|nr:hypothetical protein JB92DRAFT_3100905 [Gautieria morchelliformis]